MELLLTDCTRIAFLDPSGGHTQIKRQRARAAIVVVAGDNLGRIFCLHAWAGRVSTDTMVEKVFWINETFRPRIFGCEANALQKLFAETLTIIAKHREIKLPLTPYFQPTQIDKFFRNRTILQPVLANGRLFLNVDDSQQQELVNELRAHPTGTTVDLVDALATTIKLMPRHSAKKVANDEERSLAAYLRRIGTAPADITRRLEQIKQQGTITPTEDNQPMV